MPTGDAVNPMRDAGLEAKFLAGAALALGPEQAALTLELIRGFERLDDVRRLTAALTAPTLTAQRRG